MFTGLLPCVPLQVAVILFCNDFFSSYCCSEEARKVVEESGNGRFIYLPVFFTATTADVKRMAKEAWGEEMSSQVEKVGCAWIWA
jgi:hypothetical protein